MAEPKLDMQARHWAIVQHLLQRHAAGHEVWAFGSRAKGTAKPYSDLDLAIITSEPLSLAQSAALADVFADSELPWRVDLVDWATTNEAFRKLIERDMVLVQAATEDPAAPD